MSPLRACYPGSFDPLTVAHVAIGRAVLSQVRGATVVEFVLSRSALGKPASSPSSSLSLSLEARCAAIEACGFGAVVTDAQLLADIAEGYDALVLGADKWAQLLDVSFYGGSVVGRDAALARLPRVLAVAPRPGFDVPTSRPGVVALSLDEALSHVSSTAVRSGATHWLARPRPQTRQSPE